MGDGDELILFLGNAAAVQYRAQVPSNGRNPPDAVPLPGGRGVVTRTVIARYGYPNPLPPGIEDEDWAAAADAAPPPPQPPPYGLDAIPAETRGSDRVAQAAPQTAGRLVLTRKGVIGATGHWNCCLAGKGSTRTYTDPQDASVRVDLWVYDLAPTQTATDEVRSFFNFGFFTFRFAQNGILAANVRRDAPVPYFLTGNPQVGYTLFFGVKGGDWVVEADAPTRADLEAVVRGLISGLTSGLT